MIHKATNMELKVTRLQTLEVVNDEVSMNLGSYGEQEDIDKERNNMAWNENNRLMCQWLALNPLKPTNEVKSIYTSFEIEYL